MVVAVAMVATLLFHPSPAGAAGPAPGDLAAIRSEQARVVTQDYQPAIDLAQLVLIGDQSIIANDQAALTGVQAAAVSASRAATDADRRLAIDRSFLMVAVADDRRAHARLADDRSRLRGIAIGLYTGALTGPTPAVLQSLPTSQQAAADTAMAEIVANTIVKAFNVDLTVSSKADARDRQLTAIVAGDRRASENATAAAAAAALRVPPAAAALAAAEQQGLADQRRLTLAHNQLRAALTALIGPAPGQPDGLSLIGPAALDAKQLAAWYNAQGYADLTATPITQLANWYVQGGAIEGIRGDVAFAQAMLETGGFSSPDAVNLNNYAGIGHCDSCPAGWPFPSPQDGAIGQLQLLRAFADPGPPPRGAPGPVLPALDPARQTRRGCCPTWESLSGVWATDPTYGAKILSLYQSMLVQTITANGT